MRNFRDLISNCCGDSDECFHTCEEVETLVSGKADKGSVYHRQTIDAKLQAINSSLASLGSLSGNYLVGTDAEAEAPTNAQTTGKILISSTSEALYVSDGTIWKKIYPAPPPSDLLRVSNINTALYNSTVDTAGLMTDIQYSIWSYPSNINNYIRVYLTIIGSDLITITNDQLFSGVQGYTAGVRDPINLSGVFFIALTTEEIGTPLSTPIIDFRYRLV